MNAGAPFHTWRIKPATAEIYFCRMFRHFLATGGTFEADPGLEDSLVSEVLARGGVGANDETTARTLVREQLADPRWRYDQQRRTFLWMDVHPEDAWRFGLTYDLCWGDHPNKPGAPSA